MVGSLKKSLKTVEPLNKILRLTIVSPTVARLVVEAVIRMQAWYVVQRGHLSAVVRIACNILQATMRVFHAQVQLRYLPLSDAEDPERTQFQAVSTPEPTKITVGTVAEANPKQSFLGHTRMRYQTVTEY